MPRTSNEQVDENGHWLCAQAGCSQVFLTRAQMRAHRWDPQSHPRYRCHICNAGMECETALATHLSCDFHPPCDLCGVQCLDDAALDTHLQQRHPNHEKCLDCGVACHNEEFLEEYMQQHHPEYHSCGGCDFVCLHGWELEAHIENEHEIQTCVRCGYQTKDEDLIVAHLQYAQCQRTSCAICGFPCGDSPALTYHYQIVHPEVVWCRFCSGMCVDEANLWAHLQQAHPEQLAVEHTLGTIPEGKH